MDVSTRPATQSTESEPQVACCRCNFPELQVTQHYTRRLRKSQTDRQILEYLFVRLHRKFPEFETVNSRSARLHHFFQFNGSPSRGDNAHRDANGGKATDTVYAQTRTPLGTHRHTDS